MFSHAAEQRAQKLVAVQFFILAPYVGVESVRAVIGGEHPDVSPVGIALAIGSIIFMPILGIAKQRLANQFGSAATAGEGRQNMLCAYLAGALLVGLIGNALVGAWWLDPLVGLLIAAVAVKEGVEAWRGEGCCVASPLDGVGFTDDCCQDDCCSTAAQLCRRRYALQRYSCAMATIQIREIPDDAYEVIRKRARAQGRSIQSYMRDWVVEFASRPTTEEALSALDDALADSVTPGATRESIQADLAADRR